MSAIAILPIKRFDSAKQRLHSQLSAGARAALATAMFTDVLETLDRSTALKSIVVVSGEPAVASLAVGPRVTVIPDITEKGQSHATLAGLARAAELDLGPALLVPGDCPLIDPVELDRAIERFEREQLGVMIVPDRHGRGTNALLVDPAIEFEPQFGEGSLARHIEQAVELELRYAVEALNSLALDIDTGEDLAELVAEFERSPDRAPHTRAVLRQIERVHPLPVPA